MSAVLTRIYRGEMISVSVSREVLTMLTVRGSSPERGLDYLGGQVAPRRTIPHLDGRLTGTRNDVGTIEGQHEGCVVVILIRDQRHERGAEDAMATGRRRIADALQHSP